ncbi:MAG: amidohydrolase [Firmicutes bacterium]|nr:amidohydrolase [Bacillota bacterium]
MGTVEAERIFTGARLVDPGQARTAAAPAHRPAAEAPAALAVAGGRILAAGPAGEVLGLRGPRTEVVDLEGAWLLPGLIDSHAHLLALGLAAQELDLSDSRSPEELESRLRRYAAEHPELPWITGRGWDESRWPERRLPRAEELDRAVADRPVVLERVCGHGAVLNGEALRRSGLAGSSGDPPGGRVDRDAHGRPLGTVWDAALERVRALLPPPSEERVLRAMRWALRRARELGLTQVHSEDLGALGAAGLESPRRLLELWRRALGAPEGRAASAPPLRLALLLRQEALERIAAEGLTLGSGDEALWVAGVKFFADGALGGRTAWLGRPYADAPGWSGLAAMPPGLLAERAAEAARLGLPPVVHAIGDAAVDAALAALERARPALAAARGRPRPRFRIVHAQVLRPDQLPRLAREELVLDIQPGFVATDSAWAEARLGAERLGAAYAWRSLLDAGVRLAGGSDAPVESLDPLAAVEAAVRRPRAGDGAPWRPEEALTRAEAFSLYTEGGAWAAGLEDRFGRLVPGFAADLTLLAFDPLRDPVPARGGVLGTVVAGRPGEGLP